ncbi:MAG TPA: Gfo/Idh/MocA family oxidoreductase [Candidatus Saccharicenans sp.]|nr:Gfo/Idh/MocA family oxidoreductase [Candidatus Saccharicenans sp.]HPU93191.1 Gfo/Idh/MocA family oxidoreductase [Candidatus Saccharicenans sp.]
MDKKDQSQPDINSRRQFLKLGLTGTAGLWLTGRKLEVRGQARKETPPAATDYGPLFTSPPLKVVRVGFVGVGGMGSVHVRNFLNIDGVEIKAICDIVEEKVARAQKWVEEAGFPRPRGYSAGPWDFKRMCEEEDLDLVFTATPWEWHVPVCLTAMKNGKHAATEVPAAVTHEECWQLVEAAEKYKKHCVMMENCCYDRIELMSLNMVRRGLLGEIVHAAGGYLHDLRAVKFSNAGEGLWRRQHSSKRNGNLYPTHGLGPVAQCLNVNRGDVFDYLVSMSSPAFGLHLYAVEKFGPDSPQAKEKFVLGDVNSSLIKTKLGKTIILIHDTNLPRPYSRIHLLQGTKGILQKWPDRIYVEGRSPEDDWEDIEKYAAEFEHPLWKKLAQKGEGRGHGGMDFIEDYRLIECLRTGQPTDMNVYDAAAWSVVSALTEKSVAEGSKPLSFPDFTRGRWKTTPPLGIIDS